MATTMAIQYRLCLTPEDGYDLACSHTKTDTQGVLPPGQMVQ